VICVFSVAFHLCFRSVFFYVSVELRHSSSFQTVSLCLLHVFRRIPAGSSLPSVVRIRVLMFSKLWRPPQRTQMETSQCFVLPRRLHSGFYFIGLSIHRIWEKHGR